MIATLLPILTLVLAGVVECASAQAQAPPPIQSGQAQKPAEVRTLESDDGVLREALDAVRLSKNCETLTALGSRYLELGVREAAANHFSEAVRIDGRCAAAHDGLARLWRNAGVSGLAAASAHRATYFAPDSARFWNTYGTIQQALERPDEAAAAYRKVVQLDPSAAYAHSNLCYLGLQAGDAEAARAACNAALAIDPAYAPALNNLALVHAASGDGARAFELFSSARGVAAAHYNMGMVRLSQKDYVKAITEFEAAYREDPAFDDAHAAARRARRLLKQQTEKSRADDRRK